MAKCLTISTPLITRSTVNVCVISIVFLLVSLVTNQVSIEEVCLPRFEVLACWLNLVASCLDDEKELTLNVIASFSAINSFVQMRFWMSFFSLCRSGDVGSLFQKLSCLVFTACISAGTCSLWSLWHPVGWGAMLP